ncbi:MAG TPA: hypothetical protein VGK73_17230 [Polyangiaceae bacterium]
MANESKDPRDSDTVRDLPKPSHVIRDTVPEQAGVYVAPRPLAPSSDHRTIQIKPVLLASHVDPRRAPTELRLSAPPPPQPRPQRIGWLIPLALLAIALGVIVAIRVTEEPGAPSGTAADPKSTPEVREGSVVTGAGTTANSPPSTAETRPPEVEFRDLPSEPSQSAAPRKKKRDPWLE